MYSAEELLGIFADPTNTTDSPDLGPPPVAHFDEGDPIKFDPTHELSPRKVSAESTEETQPKLSANLETRKKRRESSHRRDVSMENAHVDSNQDTASLATAMPASQPLKSSAKRKINARDDKDEATIVEEPGNQNVQLNRRGSDLRVSENNITKPIPSGPIKLAEGNACEAVLSSNCGKDGKEKASGASAAVMATGRKALGPSRCCKKLQVSEILMMLQKV